MISSKVSPLVPNHLTLDYGEGLPSVWAVLVVLFCLIVQSSYLASSQKAFILAENL